jgi:hypothetical protein
VKPEFGNRFIAGKPAATTEIFLRELAAMEHELGKSGH